MIELSQTLSPLVEQAQELTLLVNEHLRVLGTIIESDDKKLSAEDSMGTN